MATRQKHQLVLRTCDVGVCSDDMYRRFHNVLDACTFELAVFMDSQRDIFVAQNALVVNRNVTEG